MSKINNNQQKALIALVESASVADAATKCGLTRETLFRYLKDADFVKEYRTMRRQVVEGAITEIQQSTSEAVATLKRNLTCGKASDENRAAQIILDNAIKGVELVDVMERLEALENAVETKD